MSYGYRGVGAKGMPMPPQPVNVPNMAYGAPVAYVPAGYVAPPPAYGYNVGYGGGFGGWWVALWVIFIIFFFIFGFGGFGFWGGGCC